MRTITPQCRAPRKDIPALQHLPARGPLLAAGKSLWQQGLEPTARSPGAGRSAERPRSRGGGAPPPPLRAGCGPAARCGRCGWLPGGMDSTGWDGMGRDIPPGSDRPHPRRPPRYSPPRAVVVVLQHRVPKEGPVGTAENDGATHVHVVGAHHGHPQQRPQQPRSAPPRRRHPASPRGPPVPAPLSAEPRPAEPTLSPSPTPRRRVRARRFCARPGPAPPRPLAAPNAPCSAPPAASLPSTKMLLRLSSTFYTYSCSRSALPPAGARRGRREIAKFRAERHGGISPDFISLRLSALLEFDTGRGTLREGQKKDLICIMPKRTGDFLGKREAMRRGGVFFQGSRNENTVISRI